VRDVADLHLRAMLKPEAAGQRLLASAGQPLKLLEIAAILRAALGHGGARIPTREVPDWVVRQPIRPPKCLAGNRVQPPSRWPRPVRACWR
jgi:nucleoside-diphosphate-sugar epimerase